MKNQELSKSIATLKRAIRVSENNVVNTLRGNLPAINMFKQATREFNSDRSRSLPMGAADDDTPWYENKFVTKLMDIGTSQLTARNDQKTLQIQLDTVAQQNTALDKQLSLQARLKNVGAYGGSFIDELMASPTKLALIAGLGFAFFKFKGK